MLMYYPLTVEGAGVFALICIIGFIVRAAQDEGAARVAAGIIGFIVLVALVFGVVFLVAWLSGDKPSSSDETSHIAPPSITVVDEPSGLDNSSFTRKQEHSVLDEPFSFGDPMGMRETETLHRQEAQASKAQQAGDFLMPDGLPPPPSEEQQQHEFEAAAAATAEAVAMPKRVLAFRLEAASNGLPTFQYQVGLAYLNGDGVPTNKELAIYWINESAKQGNSDAMSELERLQPNLFMQLLK